MISDVYQSSCVHGRVEGSATVGCAVHVAYLCTWQQESGAERGIVEMLPSWQYGLHGQRGLHGQHGLHSQHGYGQCYLHGQSQSGQVWQLAPVVALGGAILLGITLVTGLVCMLLLGMLYFCQFLHDRVLQVKQVQRLILAISLLSCSNSVWALPLSNSLAVGTSWEAGRLDYVYGGSEVAAFVNTPEQIQLQLVLCAKNEAAPYRFSVLLPRSTDASGIIPVKLMVDGVTTSLYAEILNNSLEFQVGANFLITLPESPTLEMEFNAADAKYLQIPEHVSFSMERAHSALDQVAKSCTILCREQGFACSKSLIAGMLWPHQGFNTMESLIAIRTHGERAHDSSAGDAASGDAASGDATASGDADAEDDPTVKLSQELGVSPDEVVDIDRFCLQWSNGALHARGALSGTPSGLISTIHQGQKLPHFVPTAKCKKALDLVYARTGADALSFLHQLFHQSNGFYQQYVQLWNGVVRDTAHWQQQQPEPEINDFDYYLALFSLFSDTPISQYPQSYYDILKLREDPSSFIYAIDNRYELETVKYYSVLSRRVHMSLSLNRNISKALSLWQQFYQDFSMSLPPIAKAQALRPLIYRQMLMRVWRLAGHPESLRLRPQYNFTQGTGGKPRTNELLEARCSIFEGSNGDQFFFASSECVQSIASDIRRQGLLNDDLRQVLINWDAFAKAWRQSDFFSQNDQDDMGEHLRSGLSLTLLSLYKTYGFGDYFLLRKCLSTRDSDICAYDAYKNQNLYSRELRKNIADLSLVAGKEARALSDLSKLWERYYESLCTYTNNLAQSGKIPRWRASFVQAVATTSQSESVLQALFTLQHQLVRDAVSGGQDSEQESEDMSSEEREAAESLSAAAITGED